MRAGNQRGNDGLIFRRPRSVLKLRPLAPPYLNADEQQRGWHLMIKLIVSFYVQNHEELGLCRGLCRPKRVGLDLHEDCIEDDLQEASHEQDLNVVQPELLEDKVAASEAASGCESKGASNDLGETIRGLERVPRLEDPAQVAV